MKKHMQPEAAHIFRGCKGPRERITLRRKAERNPVLIVSGSFVNLFTKGFLSPLFYLRRYTVQNTKNKPGPREMIPNHPVSGPYLRESKKIMEICQDKS